MNDGIFWAPLRFVKSLFSPKLIFSADSFAEYTADVYQTGILQEKTRDLSIVFEAIEQVYKTPHIDAKGRIWFDAHKVLDILEQAHRKIAEGEE